jgi:hypothetical protein
MSRIAGILMLLSLGLAACAHDHAFDRHDVAAMKNDSPAISPWAAPVPEGAVEQDRSQEGGPGR